MWNDLFGGKKEEFTDVSPPWGDLDELLRAKENVIERTNFDNELIGLGSSNHRAEIRYFDAPISFKPEVTLYRDQAAWCPYCEKVWLQLEEKRIPYKVEKAPLRCYGKKSKEFLQISPSGMLPVAIVKGQKISESNEILYAIEEAFPEYTPLLPPRSSREFSKVDHLMRLERKAFSVWFSWLTSPRDMSSQMNAVLIEIDSELSSVSSEGPYFLGKALSLVDVMFAPFLERMAASLPYFKGFESRSHQAYPNLNKWYEAMDQRPAYRGIKSDYYTHCHDLPPQIGNCYSTPAAEKFAADIDGGSWSLTSPTTLEPMIPEDPAAAKRDAVRRIINNKNAIARFAARALGESGSPPVDAPLADPFAKPNDDYTPMIDSCLRMIMFSMLEGPEAAEIKINSTGKGSKYPVESVTKALLYLRDRIGVPRDMSVHAAKQLRSHINWFVDFIATQSHMYDT